MSKKKNQNEDSIKNFKKAVSNLLSLLGERKVPFLISVVANIISTVLVVAIPWTSAVAIDDIVKILNDNTIIDKWSAVFGFLIKPVSLLGIIAVSIFALSYLQEYISAILGEEVAQSLRVKLSRKFTKLPMNFFDTNQVGDILSKLTTDIEKVAEVIGSSFTRFVYSFLIMILVIIMLFTINNFTSFGYSFSKYCSYILCFKVNTKNILSRCEISFRIEFTDRRGFNRKSSCTSF